MSVLIAGLQMLSPVFYEKIGLMASISIPFLALALQLALWSYITPFVWFLFYPAVFFSARAGGRFGGHLSTIISILLVWYFFIPTRFSWVIENPNNIFSMALFLFMGVLFSDVQSRLKKSNIKIQLALEEARDSKEKISELYEKTRELDDLKTHFFANISHELRTPLTLINLSLKKISSGKNLNDDERYNIEIAEKNVRFLYRHVCDLLDISKLEAKKMLLRYTDTDIAQLTRVLASQFGTLAQDRGISFIVDSPGVINAQVDIEKYQRIILNILSNAFKFTPDNGSISVVVNSDGGNILIAVHDSGSGIPISMRKQVFERFRQIETSSARSHGGTGLGLSIVNEFVLLHGGTVEISEAYPNGTVFTVKIPQSAPAGEKIEKDHIELNEELKKEAIDELTNEKKYKNPGSCPDSSYSPLVMVVEDNTDMNFYISSELSKKYRVVSAHDGEEALKKIIELAPDLVITDAMMPKKSGEELVADLLNNSETSSIPVIMLTAKAEDTLKQKMLRNGLHDFINKPFEMEELTAKIKNLLDERIRARRTLEESEKRYRLLAENVADVIWIADFNSKKIRYVSPSVKNLLGFSPDEITGREITASMTPGSAEYIKNILPHRIEEFNQGKKNSYYDEIEELRSDGTTVWTEATTKIEKNDETGEIEIYGVSRDISRRKLIEEKLINALRERETLIREIYHRTKNNMNVIISLLSLKSSNIMNPELSRVFSEIETKIRVMALVHEKLYTSQNLTYIDLDDFLYEMISLLRKSYGTGFDRIRISADIKKISIAIEVAIPVSLVINELISNSIKHAFPESGEGNIDLKIEEPEQNRIKIIYSDNGTGVPEKFDFRNQPSLGLQIIFMIVEHQLNGRIDFNCGETCGLSCTILFDNQKKDSGLN